MTDFIELETLRRSPKPNNYLIAPPGYCQQAEPDAEPPLFDASARDLFSQLNEMIAAERLWALRYSDPETLQFHVVARTPLLRFKDDVYIQIIAPDAEAVDQNTSLAIYSGSRIGHSDLGANKKRVVAMLEMLTVK